MSLMIWTAMGCTSPNVNDSHLVNNDHSYLWHSRRQRSAHPAVANAAAHPALGERLDGRKVLFQKAFGGCLDLGQQVRVTHQIGHPHLGQAGLASAEQFARPTQFQVSSGNDEAVIGLADGLEPRAP